MGRVGVLAELGLHQVVGRDPQPLHQKLGVVLARTAKAGQPEVAPV
jgi:hypothetical protein